MACADKKCVFTPLFDCKEYDDECVTASEIYSCGREKEPGIVDVIFNTEKGNSTIVSILCVCDPTFFKI
jgi:hypothetical protein